MSDKLERGLIIRQPHIGKILDGIKPWEMRSTYTNIRGRIGLIEAGSGLIVGEAVLYEVFGKFDDLLLDAYKNRHQCEVKDLQKWRYAWALSSVKKYEKPIPYKHPMGAVIWVKL